jgi:alpha-glucosidase
MSADLWQRLKIAGNPVANGLTEVYSGNARFQILTPYLVRLEWSETGQFEDRGTFAFPNRYVAEEDVPEKVVREVEINDGIFVVIDTTALSIRYKKNSGRFTSENLSITFSLNGQQQTWKPGMTDPLNLRGTRRTLDGAAGDVRLDEGLLSRSGWALIDDSRSVLLNREDSWVEPRPDWGVQDWYFFGYGHDYKAALADYTRFGGEIPLIPRYVLGSWWSRYWAYSEQDLRDLVKDFQEHELPLDILVLDMDWHTPDTWTGYSWNRELFPDPPGFLKWLHERGLRTTLNLHPAEGVKPLEDIYPEFAKAMGQDPTKGEPVPFRITDKRFVKNYFELLHHPLEEEGVDFWWMDWQQGETSEMKGLDPLIWLNHLHFHDSTRRGQRPMLYSRWGGLGNHRYHIGFSGDTYATWGSLAFQPYFTATASNVLFGWWSHDIGGHFGATEPELFARWVQYGTLSPCLRLHATKDPLAERRPWTFTPEVLKATLAAFRLRYQLIPYLYTLAREASDKALPLCRPMYYEYPESESAYASRYQYYMGDQIIAAPFVRPADPVSGLATNEVWLAEGRWIEFATKEVFEGPRWVRLFGDLQQMPMLVKAGAIVPLAPMAETTDAISHDRLILKIFPVEGMANSFRLYEDDGLTEAYKQGQAEWTPLSARTITQSDGSTSCEVEIGAVEGFCEILPRQRSYELRLEGTHQPDRVTINGQESSDWGYDAQSQIITIQTGLQDKNQPVKIVVQVNKGALSLYQDREFKQTLIQKDLAQLLGPHYPGNQSDLLEKVLALPEQTARRSEAIARLGGPFVRFSEHVMPEEAVRHLGSVLIALPVIKPQDKLQAEINWTFFRGEHQETYNEQKQLDQEQAAQREGGIILYSPFAFLSGEEIQATRWEAEVRLKWGEQTLSYNYRSHTMFPSVPRWEVLAYNPDKQPELTQLAQVTDEQGQLNAQLNWEKRAQSTTEVQSLEPAFYVKLPRSQIDRVRAGEPLALYKATTVISPDEREMVIDYWTNGDTTLYLNGQVVGITGDSRELPWLSSVYMPSAHYLFKTQPVKLRAGKNTLIFATSLRASEWWYHFSAALVEPGTAGEVMTDLRFE